jgi:methylmalonyl-CoA/ethylmalonyl-CoA epimerase
MKERRMATVRRVDHIAIVVTDTEAAMEYYCDRLGLVLAHSQVNIDPHVRLTYLDAGNIFIQLVEALDADSDAARFLAARGEGLHHICFAADDVAGAAALSGGAPRSSVVMGTGRGRAAAFAPGSPPNGVPIEYTEFRFDEDVEATRGWLPG